MKMLPFLMILCLCLSPLFGESLSPGGESAYPGGESAYPGGESANQPVSASMSSDLTALAGHLGRSLEDVLTNEGLPDEMYTVRGPSPGQDSVVFFYKNRVSLFWAESHVWQVRVDGASLASDSVLRKGMSRGELAAVLGRADLEREDFLIYTLPQKGYPVACALYFEEEGLSDLYVYRSDF